MAYIHFFAFATVAAIMLPTITMAADYIVGDGKGWNAGVDYQAWASSSMFDYKPPNSAHSVKEEDFNKCIASGGGEKMVIDVVDSDPSIPPVAPTP
ncbi:hypothetical protein Tsubulata_036716, partial [Turnera subulata]